MIGVIFQYGSEKVEVRIHNSNCLFRTTQVPQFVPIDALKLNKKGSIKEFPDLKDRDDWRKETIKRFKQKVKSFKTEQEQIQYVIDDLTKYGYKPLFLQRAGSRPIKLY